jgi:AcrR family transcriptional regulator
MRTILGGPTRRNVKKIDKILNVAEREFAARGFKGTPLRRIASGAKINQALINYYFGSKEKLFHAIFLRRGSELTRERLRLLDELESRSSKRPTVEELIKSFLSPAIIMRDRVSDGRAFLRLLARLQNEPKEMSGKIRKTVFDEATLRYIQAFKAALPQVDQSTIVWRMTMMIGAYLYIAADASRLEQLSNGLCDASDENEVIRQLSAFMTGGFKASL